MNNLIPVTKKQQDIVSFIEQFEIENGTQPTQAQIAEHFHVSVPTINEHLQTMRAKQLKSHRCFNFCPNCGFNLRP